jgi:membrane protein
MGGQPRVTRRVDVSSWSSGVAEVLALTYRGWRDHRVIRLGAALAYYGLFALVPLVTIVVVVADLLVDFDAALALLATPLAELLGEDVADVTAALSDRVDAAIGSAGLQMFGGAAMLLTASLLFVAFQDTLNVIWEVPVRAGLRTTLGRRLFAFGVVLAASILVTVSLAVQTVVGWLNDLVFDDFVAVAATAALVSRLVPLLIVSLALALLYASLPQARVDRRAAAVGGVLAAVGIGIGVQITGWVLARTASVSAQGAAGTVFVVLTGIYVVAQISLGGGVLTRVLSERWSGASALTSSPTETTAAAGDHPTVTSALQEEPS